MYSKSLLFVNHPNVRHFCHRASTELDTENGVLMKDMVAVLEEGTGRGWKGSEAHEESLGVAWGWSGGGLRRPELYRLCGNGQRATAGMLVEMGTGSDILVRNWWKHRAMK